MQEFPLSDTEIVLDSLEERSHAPQLSDIQKPLSEIRLENQAEQKSDNSVKKPRSKKLKDGEIINTDIS
jgi:hypothetical protein